MQTTIWVQLEERGDAGIIARWFVANDINNNSEALRSAGLQDFEHWLSTRPPANMGQRAVLLLSGDQVVSRELAFAPAEKKHLQKLLPFMLESQLAVDLAQVHVAYALTNQAPADSDTSSAQVAYTDKKQLQWRIAALESLGLEVEGIYAIPSLLPASDSQWTLLQDAGVCHLHAGRWLSTSAEPALLPVLLDAALAGLPVENHPAALTMWVPDFQSDPSRLPAAQALLSSEHSRIKDIAARLHVQPLVHAWARLDTSQAQAVNLRQGEFAAPLRLDRYWRQWRVPAIAAMLALTTVMVTAIVEVQINKYRSSALEARIEQRYREVMPEGVLVDAAQQLSAQVAQRRTAETSQSLTAMLDQMLVQFEQADSVLLHRLSYSARDSVASPGGMPRSEIQLSISAPTTADILQLSENLTAAGWTAQAQNISRVGNNQQANLLIAGSGVANAQGSVVPGSVSQGSSALMRGE